MVREAQGDVEQTGRRRIHWHMEGWEDTLLCLKRPEQVKGKVYLVSSYFRNPFNYSNMWLVFLALTSTHLPLKDTCIYDALNKYSFFLNLCTFCEVTDTVYLVEAFYNESPRTCVIVMKTENDAWLSIFLINKTNISNCCYKFFFGFSSGHWIGHKDVLIQTVTLGLWCIFRRPTFLRFRLFCSC